MKAIIEVTLLGLNESLFFDNQDRAKLFVETMKSLTTEKGKRKLKVNFKLQENAIITPNKYLSVFTTCWQSIISPNVIVCFPL